MSDNFLMREIYNFKAIIFEREDNAESDSCVIIIDDLYDSVKLNFQEASAHPDPDAKVLSTMKETLIQFKSILKIAFFRLPHKDEDITILGNSVIKWINEIVCEKIYILVDIYFGPTGSYEMGVDLANYLEQHSENCKIAFFSKAGYADQVAYKDRKIFDKSKISTYYKETQKLPLSLLEWLDENPHPLDILWDRTKDWFSTNNIKSIENNPGDVNKLHSFSTDWWGSSEFKENYKSNINEVLNTKIPEQWFKDESSVEIFHESLKTLCGSNYCGTPVIECKYNLTMGAVYLISLLAMREADKYYDLTQDINGKTYQLDKYMWLCDSKFLSKQFEEDAKIAAKALFDLFYNFFRRTPKHKNKKLKQFSIITESKKFIFSFEWSASPNNVNAKKSTKNRKYLSDQINTKKSYSIIDSESPNAIHALETLLVSMVHSKEGFGSPGTVWMEGNDLFVASANSPKRALIVCSDDRYKKWAELLFDSEVNEVYVLKNENEIMYFNLNIDNKTDIEIGDIPEEFCCAIIHKRDKRYWEKIKKNYPSEIRKFFWFSGPGISNVKSGLPIMRSTSGDFDVTTDDIIQVVDYSLGKRSEIPDICKPKPTGELLTSIFILSQGYLIAGVAAGKIKDNEVKTLVGWNDKINEKYPVLKSGWEKVRKPEWWDDLGKIDNLKEQVQKEMNGKLDEHVGKLIDYIKGKDAIEDFETVKIVFKMLKEKKWS